jgi:hypothetical protein
MQIINIDAEPQKLKVVNNLNNVLCRLHSYFWPCRVILKFQLNSKEPYCVTHVKTHKLLQVCKPVHKSVHKLSTSCVRTVTSLDNL